MGRGGVVRDPAVHRAVVLSALDAAVANGFRVAGLTRSPLTGPAGNIEFLAKLRLGDVASTDVDSLIRELDLTNGPL